jgi:hypothetical protein
MPEWARGEDGTEGGEEALTCGDSKDDQKYNPYHNVLHHKLNTGRAVDGFDPSAQFKRGLHKLHHS